MINDVINKMINNKWFLAKTIGAPMVQLSNKYFCPKLHFLLLFVFVCVILFQVDAEKVSDNTIMRLDIALDHWV